MTKMSDYLPVLSQCEMSARYNGCCGLGMPSAKQVSPHSTGMLQLLFDSVAACMHLHALNPMIAARLMTPYCRATFVVIAFGMMYGVKHSLLHVL
jgi:hypothetical protein